MPASRQLASRLWLSDWQSNGYYREDGGEPSRREELFRSTGGRVGIDLAIGLGTAERQTGDPAFRDTLLDAAHRAADLGDTDRLAAARSPPIAVSSAPLASSMPKRSPFWRPRSKEYASATLPGRSP